jgi:putative FmdB family regulatory protein
MPVYDYRCRSCGSTYDIFHKVREMPGDVACPACGSAEHIRLISAPSVRVSSGTAPRESAPVSAGCCGGGACSLN